MTIKKQAFTMALLPPPPEPGEVVFLNSSSTTTFSWIVPENVYRICAVTVACPSMGGGQAYPRISRGTTVLLSPDMALGVGGVGGGNGGQPGKFYGQNTRGGGGGAGGYAGDGGNGGDSSTLPTVWGSCGAAGSGGAGGGSAGPMTKTAGATSGPVGLLGAGPSGGVSSAPSNDGRGAAGSNLGGVLCGAVGQGYPGGNLRWLNDIPVTPGETLTITMYQRAAPDLINGVNEGIRILWGNDGRSYPSNATDAIPKGQLVFTSNTTWTVPAGVTSICACAQQADGNASAVSLVVAGVTVLRAQNGNRLGDGGGDGGAAGSGGGGGGGYTGNGGVGGAFGVPAGAGSGGAGAGGQQSTLVWVNDPVVGGSNNSPGHWEGYPAGKGGGVGISGQGASGTTPGALGSPDPINGYIGGGPPGVAGGALAYKNNIAVTPGQVLTVNAAGGRMRFVWGPGRSYPSNAGNV